MTRETEMWRLMDIYKKQKRELMQELLELGYSERELEPMTMIELLDIKNKTRTVANVLREIEQEGRKR